MKSYAGIGLGFSQPETLIESLISAGCEIQSPLNDYKFGATMHPEEDDMKTTDVRYATLVDKNGYIIEVVDSFDVDGEPAGGALTRLILYVEDLDESIDFYTNVLGMNLLRKRSNINNTPKDASMVAHVVGT